LHHENIMVQIIDRSLIERVSRAAEAAPRKRLNHNFHSDPGDNPHRFLNVLLQGTYIRPHRHLDPPKAETFLVLEGRAALLVFDDGGRITGRYHLANEPDGALGVDLAPGVWHTVIALSGRVVCFEVKPGPWDAASDKEFAVWAPAEGAAEVAEYLQYLTLPAPV
jgi:cupin fold WbuC family metalloprotein